MSKIPERDWKRLRAITEEKLGQACESILAKIEKILKNRKGKEHKTYLDIWKVLEKEDEKIARMFNDPRRSNAIFMIAALRVNGYLSDEEMKEFSAETQEKVKIITKI